jgi:putative sporulation protein YtaF
VALVELVMILMLALAVSGDGFLVGVAYGVKKIKIPLISLLVIALASTTAVTVSMLCGKGLASVLSPEFASRTGAILLLIIGMYFILQACGEKINNLGNDNNEPIITIKVKPLGIIVQILKQPSSADMDCSGEISLHEAFFLGLALALDALGAGLGAAMAGFNILLTAICVGVLKFILLNSGIYLGRLMGNQRWLCLSSLLPGIILVTIGLVELI